MRHVQQLKLMRQFKEECEAKGYMQPSWELRLNGSDGESFANTSLRWKREVFVRLVRSGDLVDNGTMSTISELYGASDDTDIDFGGVFHEPSTVQNDYLEAICGNLTLK